MLILTSPIAKLSDTCGQVRMAWASELVGTKEPFVLFREDTGEACLVVGTLGPAILTWPLRWVSDQREDAALVRESGVCSLRVVFLDTPCPRQTTVLRTRNNFQKSRPRPCQGPGEVEGSRARKFTDAARAGSRDRPCTKC